VKLELGKHYMSMCGETVKIVSIRDQYFGGKCDGIANLYYSNGAVFCGDKSGASQLLFETNPWWRFWK